MPIQDKLSNALGHNDQGPNKALAKEIADAEDAVAIEELVKYINMGPSRRMQMDATLTLAYVCEAKPAMAISLVDFFVSKLNDPIERVGWGSMIGLAHLTPLTPESVYAQLTKILDAMDRTSIVGRDHGFKILVLLYERKQYSENLIHLILEQILKSPPNQLGQYTERLLSVILDKHRIALIKVLEERRKELDNESHLKRLRKNLKKLYK